MIRTLAHGLADVCFALDGFIQHTLKPMARELPAFGAFLLLMVVLFFWWVGTPA